MDDYELISKIVDYGLARYDSGKRANDKSAIILDEIEVELKKRKGDKK